MRAIPTRRLYALHGGRQQQQPPDFLSTMTTPTVLFLRRFVSVSVVQRSMRTQARQRHEAIRSSVSAESAKQTPPPRRTHVNEWVQQQQTTTQLSAQQVTAYFEASSDAQRSHLSLTAVRVLVKSFVATAQIGKALDLLGAHVYLGFNDDEQSIADACSVLRDAVPPASDVSKTYLAEHFHSVMCMTSTDVRHGIHSLVRRVCVFTFFSSRLFAPTVSVRKPRRVVLDHHAPTRCAAVVRCDSDCDG
jgi:hypothetical protein